MAQSSGRVATMRPLLPASQFTDGATGATFKLEPSATSVRLTAERESTGLNASRDLMWFIGSGRIGRSFAFATDDGWLYQSPVSWYAGDAAWRASPGFERRTAVDLTRPVEPSCLLCHASRLHAIVGTQNKYDATTPFAEAGIACERCHGPGAKHVALMKHTGAAAVKDRGIVNPAKLGAPARDSICAQCHLTGAARVARASGRGRASWQPGEDLARSIAVFVWSDARDAGLTVTSHFEKLAWSRCKEASGEKLWCGTCHDPHGARVDVRSRCAGCHAGPGPEGCNRKSDCTSCHMPRSEVSDAEHAVYTDHSIPRRPRVAASPRSNTARELAPFFRHVAASQRDVALGYAVAALSEPAVRRTAFERLRAAEASDPADLAIAAQLGQFLDRMGQSAQAKPLLERVIAGDPQNTAALINLGTLYAQEARLAEAVALWQRALARNPALTQARLNLAVALLKLGRREDGIAALRQALHYDPDHRTAAELLRQVQ